MTLTASDKLATIAPVVTLTSAAAAQVRRQMARKALEGQFLRLGVRGGGCSGLSYVIDFEPEPDPEFDRIYECEGIGVVVDVKSARFLEGTLLDYNIKNLMEGGFVFQNPNAMRSCGCGTSFTTR